MATVVTTNGTLVVGMTFGADARPLTESEAKADAARRNADAEKLGIETRYEVKED